MASLIDDLINVLDEENTEYSRLYEISQKKTPIIVEGDLKKLEDIVQQEQLYLDRITNLEHKRMEATKSIAKVLNQDPEGLNVRMIIEVLKGQEQEQKMLADVHEKLKLTLKKVMTVNEMNKNLVKESLEMSEFNMNLFKSIYQGPETANYSKDAYNVNASGASSGFDAKQ